MELLEREAYLAALQAALSEAAAGQGRVDHDFPQSPIGNCQRHAATCHPRRTCTPPVERLDRVDDGRSARVADYSCHASPDSPNA